MAPPRPLRPTGTRLLRQGRTCLSRPVLRPPVYARRRRLQEILVTSAVGGVACVTWQHKSHRRQRRAEFLTHMAAFEISLSRVARWAGNHQLAGANS